MKGRKAFLRHDLAREPEAADRHRAIVGIAPVVGVDHRRRARVGVPQRHRAARARPGEARVERDAGVPQLGEAVLQPRAEHEVQLDIGRTCVRVGVPEPAGIDQGGRDRPLSKQDVAQGRPQGPVRPGELVVAEIAAAFAHHIDIDVVLQVPPDAGQVVDRIDAERLQRVAGADAGEHQQLGGADRAGGDQHLARCPCAPGSARAAHSRPRPRARSR